MKSSIFEYLDYKKYLSDWIEARASGGRGERSRIAEVLRCHVAYVSRILSGPAELSPEQADALNAYLEHSAQEADFFLLLVSYGRAGTASLREHYLRKIRAEEERRSVLRNRLDYRKRLPETEQATYFSTWYYTAIHLLLTLPELQTRDALVRYLRLSPRVVARVLEFLVSAGMAVEKKGRYTTGPVSIHLGNDSPMIARLHTNWRMQAIQSLERERPDELHYSSAVTLSREHVPEVRKALIAAIERVREVVKPSPEECLYCYSLDLFEIGGTG